MKHLFKLALTMFLIIPIALVSGEKPKHAFIGSAKCGMCHKKEADGAQFQIWQKSKHSQAFKTLTTKEADAIAAKAGSKKKAAETAECLVCHATGAGAPAEFMKKGFSMEEGVGCESCHGPGEDYKSIKVMKDKKESIANGMTEYKNEADIKKSCLECHNKKSPTYKEFDFAKRWAEIKHAKK